MKIVVDANIPLVTEFFSSVGEVIAFPPRDIHREHLLTADALVVRSVKKIDSEMLRDTTVKFVGTCTAGFDHLDTQAMEAMDITWRNAPGCNAKAVVEYIFSVLSALELSWQNAVVGIVGCGNVGGLLHRRLSQFGVRCRCFDPFLNREQNQDLGDLETVLQSDIICLHTPLTRDGPHPSLHLLNAKRLQTLKSGTVLINAGRGPAIDNQALLQLLRQRKDIRCVLDVWEDEPNIPLALAEQLSIATPHIAGHSYDGKIGGTEQIYQALCAFLQIEPAVKLRDIVPDPDLPAIQIDPNHDQPTISQAILSAYDVRQDHQNLMTCLTAGEDAAQCFDRLRKNYAKRREFFNYKVAISGNETAEVIQRLQALEFQITSDRPY